MYVLAQVGKEAEGEGKKESSYEGSKPSVEP